MLTEITVLFNDSTSILNFDGPPTYQQLRKAIAADIVGSDAFNLSGVTARGSVVAIKDAASLTRALGPRQELEVRVIQALPAPQTATDSVEAGVGKQQGRRSSSVQGNSSAAGSTIGAAGERTENRASSPQPMNAATFGCVCDAVVQRKDGSTCAMVGVGSRFLVAERQAHGALSIRDAQSGVLERTFKPLEDTDSSVNCLALLAVPTTSSSSKRSTTPRGHAGAKDNAGAGVRVWAGFSNKRIAVLDGATLSTVQVLMEHSGAVTCFCYVGGFVFSGSLDFTILQWNPENFTVVKLMAKHTNAVRCLSSIGTKLVSSSDDRSIIVWNAPTGEPLRQLQSAHSVGIRCVEAYDRSIWTGADDGLIRVWNLDSLKLEKEFSEHQGTILQLKVLNHRMFSCGNDKKVVMYDASNQTLLGPILHPHEGAVNTLTVTGTRQVFTFWTGGGSEGRLCKWAYEEGIGSSAGHHSAASVRSQSPDQVATPPSPALSFAPSSRHPTPPAAPTPSDPSQTSSSRLVRLQLEESSARDLMEAQALRRLSEVLLLEQSARLQFFISPDAALQMASRSFLDSFQAEANALLDAHEDSLRLVAFAFSDLAATSAVSQRSAAAANSLSRTQSEEHQRTVNVLRAQLATAHEELTGLHAQYDALLHSHEKRKWDLETSDNTRRQVEDSLKHYTAECTQLKARNAALEREVAELMDRNLRDQRTWEKDVRDAQHNAELTSDRLSAELRELTLRYEALEREKRAQHQNLTAAVEKAETAQRKAEMQARQSKMEEERLAKELGMDRETSAAMIKETDELYAELKATRLKEQENHKAEMDRLGKELREHQRRLGSLEDENAMFRRRLAQHSSASDSETERLMQQLEEARSGWRSEVEMLERSLTDKMDQYNALDSRARESAASLAKLQTTFDSVSRSLELTQAENERLMDKLAATEMLSEERTASHERRVLEFKSEIMDLQAALKTERLGRLDAEARLGDLEQSYEILRRRNAEERENIRNQLEKELTEERSRVQSLNESSASVALDLESQLSRKSELLSQVESQLLTSQEEVSQLRERVDFLSRKNQLLLDEVETQQRTRTEEVNGLKRSIEIKKAEVESLNERLKQEADRESQNQAAKQAEFNALHENLLEAEKKVNQAQLENANLDARVKELNTELIRLGERLVAERTAHEGSRKESADVLGDLRSELTAAKEKIQEVESFNDELKRQLQSHQEASAAARADLDRTSTRLTAILDEKNAFIDKLIQEKKLQDDVAAKLDSTTREERRELIEKIHLLEAKQEEAEMEKRRLSEEAAKAKERSDSVSLRHAALLNEKTAAMEKMKKEQITELGTLQEKLHRVETQLALAENQLKQHELEKNSTEDSLLRKQRIFEDDLILAKNRVEELKKQIQQRDEQRASEQAEWRSQIAEIQSKCDERLDAASQSYAVLQQKDSALLEEKMAEIKRLSHEVAAAQNEVQRAKDEMEKQSRDHVIVLSEAQSRVAVLEKELEAQKRIAQMRRDEVDAIAAKYRQQLVEHGAAVTAKNDELEALQNKMRSLETDVAMLKLEVEKHQQRAEEAKRESQRNEKRIVVERERMAEQVRDLTALMDKLRSQNDELKDKVDQGQRLLELQAESTAANLNKSHQHDAELRSLQERLRQAADKEARMSVELREKEDQIRALNHDLSMLEDSHQMTKTRSERSLLESKSDLEKTKDELDRLTARFTTLQEVLQHEQQRFLTESKTLRDEINALQRQYHESEVQKVQLEQQIAELSEDGDRVYAVAEATQKELQEALQLHEKRAAELAIAAEAHEEHRQELQREVRNLESKLQQLTEICGEHKSRADGLGNALNDLHHTSHTFLQYFTSSFADHGSSVVELFGASALALGNRWNGLMKLVADQREANESATEKSAREMADLYNQLQQSRAELARQQHLASQHNELLTEVRVELNELYSRFKKECGEHDATKIELMREKAANEKRRVVNEALSVTDVENYKQVIRALQGERDALELQLKVASASSSGRPPLRSPSPSEPQDPTIRMSIHNRAELVQHIIELVSGIKEACRLTYQLGLIPPQLPELRTLTSVNSWLNSARSRGDIVLRCLLTDDERRSMSLRAGEK